MVQNEEKTKCDERELDAWCSMLYAYTKEMCENPTKANKWIFDRASHDEWVLAKFPKHLASVKAFKEFYEMTGLDIREYDWQSQVKTKDGKKIVVHQHFVDEHLTTAFDFKNYLVFLYKTGELSVEKIKSLLAEQRLCWITKEENNRLSAKGYYKHRNSPLSAYEACGIEIYDKENEDLSNIMPGNLAHLESLSQRQVIKDFLSSSEDIIARKEFFDKLEKYFNNFLPQYVCTNNLVEHFDIRKESDLSLSKMMVNVRVKRGHLFDICVFFGDKNAKEIFNQLYSQKDKIEKEIGYELFWDRNENKQATRIGKFGNCFPENGEGLAKVLMKTANGTYDFDLDEKKVAKELVKFYNVFAPRVKSILDI